MYHFLVAKCLESVSILSNKLITFARFCENSNIVFSFFSIIMKTLAASSNFPIKLI